MQEGSDEDEMSDVVPAVCMLDLADNPQDSMWVDVPVEGVCPGP